MEDSLILVDVDGVLNPFFPCNKPRETCPCHPGWTRYTVRPLGTRYRVRLHSEHGRALLALAASTGAELTWGTTWCDEQGDHANTWIGPKIGLPRLPWATIPSRPASVRAVRERLGRWKARHILEHANGRPFIWFDDEPDAATALAELGGTDVQRVISVDPAIGLEAVHLESARAFLAGTTP